MDMIEAALPRVTLEQWRCLVAVVDAGGYAQAALRLHKSQSSVTYAVQKLESLLDIEAFAIEGRKAVLTPTGQMLYGRARSLLDDAAGLEYRPKVIGGLGAGDLAGGGNTFPRMASACLP
jgi:DNA-binding transcriptional LysR family regulator